MALRFEVLHDSWTADGELFAAGDHVIEEPTVELVKLAAGAHGAGAIEITEGLDESHVQSQADGEAAYAAAQADGSWHEGQAIQADLDQAAREEEAEA